MSESQERLHIEDGPKRVRTYLGGELIADSVFHPEARCAHGPAHSDRYRYRVRVQGVRSRRRFLSQLLGLPFSSTRNEGAGIDKDFEGLDEKLVGDRRPDQSVVRVRTCTGVGGHWPRSSDIPDC
jgi:hypothetical protein